jgi:NSS family neurotransmitter:Na+ symporter
MMTNNRDGFSKHGFILSAIGSSVGLGNMWKFPYITGMHGGAAFFLLFILCLIVAGLPILLAELAVGRGGRADAASAFSKLSGSTMWSSLGFISVLGAFIIMSFYAVVAGWTLHYMVISLTGTLYENTDYANTFTSFTAGWMPLVWQIIVMVVCVYVLLKGVAKGIEAFNKILIPLLVVILLVLMGYALSLPNAADGVAFFLKPDFSKLTAESALAALGHAFFSLSLGMGIMITYGAYVDSKQSLPKASLAVGGGDLLYALLAGLIIFPTVFSVGIEPQQGPGLVFMALPVAFHAMPIGSLISALFFFVLGVAALTSAVSILEVPVAYAAGKWGWSREKAVLWISICCLIVGVPSALSIGGPLGHILLFGKKFFDFMDFVASNVLLPIGGMVVTLFTGYVWKRAGEEAGLNGWLYKSWMFLLRYIAPLLIVLIFLYSVGLF